MMTGCGGGTDKEKDGTKDAAKDGAKSSLDSQTKQRLTELLALVKEGKNEAAAAYIVYRGEDAARKWKDVCNYASGDEKAHVDSVCTRLSKLAAAGPVSFVSFRQEKESEGVWLAWEVKFGEGETAKGAQLACLEIKGKPSLGDVDAVQPK